MAAELEQRHPTPGARPQPRRTAGQALELKGRKKAAVLLVSLGPDRAAEVFKHLHDDEIESLSLEMAKLQHVEPLTTGDRARGARGDRRGVRLADAGGVDYAREVLERALGAERALEIIGRLSSVIEMRPFEFLRRTPPEQIVTFLRNESPQTVALVVANLHTTLAAQVLSNLPERAGRDRAADRADGRDQPGGRQAGRGRDAQEARHRRPAGVLAPPAGSSRWPRSSTTPTARPSATCSTR